MNSEKPKQWPNQQTDRHKIHSILLNMVTEISENERRVIKGKDTIEEQAENDADAISRSVATIQALIAEESRVTRIRALTDVENLGLLDINDVWHDYYMKELALLTPKAEQ